MTMTTGLRPALLLAALALAGCGSSAGQPGAAPDGGEPAGGPCNVVVQQQPSGGAMHTGMICDPVSYASNPPSSGTHYPIWADFKIYDKPVPWGFLVHDLEHGAVVISYHCPTEGCAVDTSAVLDFVGSLAPDNICLSRKLIIVVPDPTPDAAPFAASAWTWTLRADCFDATAFGAFIDRHYGQGPERVCGAGTDRSATGWCP